MTLVSENRAEAAKPRYSRYLYNVLHAEMRPNGALHREKLAKLARTLFIELCVKLRSPTALTPHIQTCTFS